MRFAALVAAALVAAGSGAAEELLPMPASLEPAVRFWTRVYTEVDGSSGLIHDAEHLDVVYEVIDVPRSLSGRAREARVEQAKSHIRAALRTLAEGKRSGLSASEAEVLARWPDGVSNATLRDAIDNVRFQLGQADRYREGLIRSGAWRPFIEQTLRDHGVPVELAALPHVESSFNPNAYSRVGAAGLWQFTRSTGRLFLHVDDVLDERLDPQRATVGAARLLRRNHDLTGAWPLAITSYNHGVGGMQRATRMLGTRDIGRIVQEYKSRSFGFASRNFYASFLAALHVDRNAPRYFGNLRRESPVTYETVELPFYYPAKSLSRALGVDLDLLREHNPALRPSVWQGSKRVPRGYALKIPRGSLSQPGSVLLAQIPSSERLEAQHRDRYYRVRRGDTLSRIASRYGLRESELLAANDLRSRHSIHPGQVLVLPDRGETVVVAAREKPSRPTRVAATTAAAPAPTPATPEAPPSGGVYAVAAGDTLYAIARRFGTSEAELARTNGLRDRNHIRPGMTLRVPGSVVIASAADTVPIGSAPAPEAEPVAVAPAPAPTPAPEVEVPAASPATAPALAVASVEPAAAGQALTDGEAPAAAPPPGGATTSDDVTLESDEPERVTASALAEQADLETEDAEADAEDVEVAAAPAVPAAATPSPVASDPSDYAVHPDGRVTVQAAETLGHYAEWLEVSASTLRTRNGMRGRQPIVIGRTVRLDFSRVPTEEFERRRLAYHRTLQSEFFEHFAVTGTEQHVLKKGESLWYLAERKYRVPVWLLRQYNPDLDFGALPAGAALVVPLIEPRSG
jgi:membrane-bound lytic murein transglycosylase D